MFEINIDNNSARISLARAAQLTGYHQDYLGQLCRLGKLPAQKVGRTWFTSAQALNSLAKTEEQVQEEIPQVDAVTAPIISSNIVGELDGLPIRIVTIPAQTRHVNNVQNILTNARIEALQNEVLQLRELLSRLMEEVKVHAGILEAREIVNRTQDSLKHSYVSNFDFSVPGTTITAIPASLAVVNLPAQSLKIDPPAELNRRYELAEWFAAAAALSVVAFIGFTVISGNFFGAETPTQTVYTRPINSSVITSEQTQASVAGVESPPESGTLPTDSAGELNPNVVQ